MALMGPSGCGKSSLLHLCGAMDTPSSGSLVIEGTPLQGLDDLRLDTAETQPHRVCIPIFQPLAHAHCCRKRCITAALGRRRKNRKQKKKQAAGLIVSGSTAGVDTTLNSFPAARCNARHSPGRWSIGPHLLLADEPTGNLDSTNSVRVLELLRELNEETKAAVLLATHSAEIAAGAKRVLHMRDGVLENQY